MAVSLLFLWTCIIIFSAAVWRSHLQYAAEIFYTSSWHAGLPCIFIETEKTHAHPNLISSSKQHHAKQNKGPAPSPAG